jgi:hypothetical protein
MEKKRITLMQVIWILFWILILGFSIYMILNHVDIGKYIKSSGGHAISKTVTNVDLEKSLLDLLQNFKS